MQRLLTASAVSWAGLIASCVSLAPPVSAAPFATARECRGELVEPAPSEDNPAAETSSRPECERLDSRLVQLAQAADPATFAELAGMAYADGAVRVVVELGEDVDFTATDGFEVEARYANLVQARVPLEQLCSVASQEGVRFVRPPARPALQSPRPSDDQGPLLTPEEAR